ncbi:MAG: hypothetical protein ACAI44_10375 [Candidatus Sericytochromatia bacterium]
MFIQARKPSRTTLPLVLTLSLTLYACSQGIRPGSGVPSSSAPAAGPPASTSATAAPAAGASSAPAADGLVLTIRGESSLQDFALQQLGVCLDQLRSVKTSLLLPADPDPALAARLRAQGVSITGRRLEIRQPIPSLTSLLEGISFTLPALSSQALDTVALLLGPDDQVLAQVGFVVDLPQSRGVVTVLIRPVPGSALTRGCPRLTADITQGPAGGPTRSQPGLSFDPPAGTASPGPGPGSSPSPGSANAPANAPAALDLRLAARSSESLTLLWDFALNTPHSYTLFLDGRVLASEITNSNYLVTGLNPDTEYRLELQTVAAGHAGEKATLLARTFSNGSEGSGNFSGGGSSRGRSNASPSPSQELILTPHDEFLVNTLTSQAEEYPSIAQAADGSFVIVWTHRAITVEPTEIRGQRYDSQGNPAGSEFLVSVPTVISYPAEVAMSDSGSFVVTWSDDNGDGQGTGVMARRYNSSGVAQDSGFRVNTYTTSDQNESAIAMAAAGNFIISWTSFGEDGNAYGVFAQRFNSAGAKVGSEFPVNVTTVGSQSKSNLAIDDDGDFVVTWSGDGADPSGYGIYARLYNSGGTVPGGEFVVNEFITSTQQLPGVAMDADGDFAITWLSEAQDSGYRGIYARRYDNTGQDQGSEFRVNTYTGTHKSFAASGFSIHNSIAMNASGEFIITWNSLGQDPDNSRGVYAQRYDSLGVAEGSEFQVNVYTTNTQASPAVVLDDAGNFTISWQSLSQDQAYEGIYARRYLLE